jgi:hypothetical protein
MVVSTLRQTVTKEGVFFAFYGALSQPFMNFFIDTVTKQFEQSHVDKKIYKSLIIIAIEQVQNIMNYSQELSSASPNQCSSLGMIALGFDAATKRYYVNGSNEIKKEDQAKITNKIEHINALDSKEQRRLLREKLKSGEDAHHKGAGVGFVEMAKRASGALEYSFEEIDSKVYFNILAYV